MIRVATVPRAIASAPSFRSSREAGGGAAAAAPAVPLLSWVRNMVRRAVSVLHVLSRPAIWPRRADGRTAEFKRFAWKRGAGSGDPSPFVRSRLSHQLANARAHRELYQFYRRWLALRGSHPALGARGKERTLADLDANGAVLTVIREAPSGPGVRLVANLTADVQPFSAPAGWQVLLDSDDVRFAGRGREPLAPTRRFSTR